MNVGMGVCMCVWMRGWVGVGLLARACVCACVRTCVKRKEIMKLNYFIPSSSHLSFVLLHPGKEKVRTNKINK